MENKIALLRGINVGGKRKILMEDLRQEFQALGFTDIQTYIQSGNVVFKDNSSKDDTTLSATIATAIKNTFGFDVPVVVRTADALAQSIQKNPFYRQNADINTLHLTFLSEIPASDLLKNMEDFTAAPDKFIIDQADVFIYCAGKYHQSKLTNNFFESKLKVNATTRNWKTVLKLLEMSQ